MVKTMNYNETINLLENKIDEVTRKGDISPSEMDCIYKATKSIYYLTTTEAMKNANYGGQSFRSNETSGWGMPNWNSVRERWSGNGPYESYGNSYNNGMRSDRSYHSVNDRIIASLEQQLNDNISDYERKKIEEEIRRIRSEMK